MHLFGVFCFCPRHVSEKPFNRLENETLVSGCTKVGRNLKLDASTQFNDWKANKQFTSLSDKLPLMRSKAQRKKVEPIGMSLNVLISLGFLSPRTTQGLTKESIK